MGPGWQFLSGNKADIALIRTKLGLYRDEGQEEDLSDHNTSLIVGNEPAGPSMERISFYDNPKVLAAVLGDELFNYKVAKPGVKSYADTIRLPKLGQGEYLFRTRVSPVTRWVEAMPWGRTCWVWLTSATGAGWHAG